MFAFLQLRYLADTVSRTHSENCSFLFRKIVKQLFLGQKIEMNKEENVEKKIQIFLIISKSWLMTFL